MMIVLCIWSFLPRSAHTIIYIMFAGGWDSGDKSKPLIPISYWLDRGYAFVSIQYRFPSQMPEGSTIFEQLDDVEDAFDYMELIRDEQALDTSRVVFVGDSAGGHLACTAAYRSGAPGIKGVVNLYGATEWKHYMDSGGKVLVHFQEKLLPDPDNPTDQDSVAASCSTYAAPDSPPILTVHGSTDSIVPLSLSEHLHSVVGALGVPNLLVKIPLGDHVLDAGFYTWGGQQAIFAMERFVAARLLG